MVRALLKSLLLPPALQLLGLLLAWWCWRRWPKLSRLLMYASFISLWLLSLPLVSHGLLASLERGYAPATAEEMAVAQAIVILGGGRNADSIEYAGDTVNARTLERLRYGAHLQRLSHLPVLVTGGVVRDNGQRPAEAQLMAAVLTRELGIAVTWQEGGSRNTAENARQSARILLPLDIETVLLVTHGWHMQRAQGVFEAAGMRVVPAPLGLSEHTGPGLLDFVPSPRALLESYFALHEWLGLWVYRLQGLL